MKFRKILLFGALGLTAALLGFLFWANSVLGPTPEALAALRSDGRVRVSPEDYIVFQPTEQEPAAGFVFYPGGRVDYRSYAAPLHQIAAEGYLVILLPVRLNLAFFDINAAQRAMAAFPQIRHWVVGGHSLGGVAAALYASRNEKVDGVVFWASYPADDSLKNTDMQILSIYGTLDMGGMDAFKESRANLPADTQFVVIEGGNHAQFGDYGFQPGDNQAAISRLDQQKQAVDATVQFLKEFSQ